MEQRRTVPRILPGIQQICRPTRRFASSNINRGHGERKKELTREARCMWESGSREISPSEKQTGKWFSRQLHSHLSAISPVQTVYLAQG